MFNFHVRGILSFGCKGFLHPRARTLLCLAPLVLFALHSVFSQTLPAALPNPAESKTPYETGLALVRSGHIDQAIDAFKKGLEIAPQDKVLLDAAGAAYSMRGQLETARSYFNASLKVDPSFVPAKQNLGITLFALGRYAEAEDQFKSLQGQPERSRAIANLFLGMIAERNSDCKAAVPALESAGALLYQYPNVNIKSEISSSRLTLSQRSIKSLISPPRNTSKLRISTRAWDRIGRRLKSWPRRERGKARPSASRRSAPNSSRRPDSWTKRKVPGNRSWLQSPAPMPS